jgi:putative hydrolase of the HAD superfamily
MTVVFFDAGNTLLRAVPGIAEIYAEVALRHGMDRDVEDIRRRFARIWKRRSEEKRTESGPFSKGQVKAWWRRFVAEIFEIKIPDHGFVPFFDELYERFARPQTWQVYEDVLPCLALLSSAQVRLGVISNWDERLPGILKSHGLTSYFETVVVSAVEGWEKPHAHIFEIALGRLGVEPDLTVHVGDSPADDARAATDAGLRGILLDREESFQEFAGERISSLSALGALLDI